MKNPFTWVVFIFVAFFVTIQAESSSIRVSQEENAGTGDFSVLGFIDVFNETNSSVEDLYSYDTPLGSSYNGTVTPSLEDTSQLFLVNSSEGLSLFVVHDEPNEGVGSRAEMRFELSNDDSDGASRLLEDDPSDVNRVGNSGAPLTFDSYNFQTHHRWDPCCTDGIVIGVLDGPWSMEVLFFDVDGIQGNEFSDSGSNNPGDLQGWVATSADGSPIPLTLEVDRRVLLEAPLQLPLAIEVNLRGNLEGPCRINGEDVLLRLNSEIMQLATGEAFVYTKGGNLDIIFEGIIAPGSTQPFTIDVNGNENTVDVPFEGVFSASISISGSSVPQISSFKIGVFGSSFGLDLDGDGDPDVQTGPWTLGLPEGGSATVNSAEFSTDPPFPELGSSLSANVTVDRELEFQGLDCVFEGEANNDSTIALAKGVSIDIKPGSDPNCINNNGHGVIPVAILSDCVNGSVPEGGFDATQVDPATVKLEGLGVRTTGNSGKLQAHIEDSNGDGCDDLVVQIKDEEGAFAEDSKTARLTGNLKEEFNSMPIFGFDEICLRP